MTDKEREEYLKGLKGLSLSTLRGRTIQLGREIRELEKNLDVAEMEHKEAVIRSIRSHLTTPTVKSIIDEYSVLGARKRIKLILQVGSIYTVILAVFIIMGGSFADDSAMVGFLALAAAVTMPILQIFITEAVKSAEPDRTSHLLLLIAEMTINRSSKPLTSAEDEVVEKWRAALEVINKQDAGEWESRRETEKVKNDEKVSAAEIKRDNAQEALHRTAEKYELTNEEYETAKAQAAKKGIEEDET
ncbi:MULTISPECIES: hypothetical protein [unclassified Exiguobacterium]|nr:MULTISPECIES: hypothetical protein [unclassified Exiguobacterium]